MGRSVSGGFTFRKAFLSGPNHDPHGLTVSEARLRFGCENGFREGISFYAELSYDWRVQGG